MAFGIAFKSGRGKNKWKNYLTKLLIMNNCLMLHSWKWRMNKPADSLNCTGQLYNVTEFNCDLYLTDWLIFTCTIRDWSFINLVRSHRIHSEASTLGRIWQWYPHVGCHLKYLCMYFIHVCKKLRSEDDFFFTVCPLCISLSQIAVLRYTKH